MSYDLPTISQTLPMRRKPILSSVTPKLRLQYRSRVGNILEIYHVTHRTTSQLGVTKALDLFISILEAFWFQMCDILCWGRFDINVFLEIVSCIRLDYVRTKTYTATPENII